MGGNRKHGFSRGNKAGRNGVGMPKGFYCDACEKEHRASVERTGLKHFVGSDVLVCDRKYLQMKDAQFQAQSNKTKAIAKLKRLKPMIALDSDKSLKSRIDFVCTVFTHDLMPKLKSNQLFDEHNLGNRDYDTCFDRPDGDLVAHGLIGLAKKSYWLKANLKKELGVTGYTQWVGVYERIESMGRRNQSNELDGQPALSL